MRRKLSTRLLSSAHHFRFAFTVAAGRSELIDVWEEAIQTRSLPLLWQTVRGATQMGLNSATGPFIDV